MLDMNRLIACLILCIFSPVALGDFAFIHCSDIHIGAGQNAKTDAALFAEMTKLSPRPAFVINTGDVCEYGTDAEYELYRETIKSLGDIPTYPAPGNHDVRWNPRGKEGYTLGTDSPLFQSWDHENVHFVTLDSTVLLEHWGHISQDQLDWLKEDLAKVGPEKPVIIGFHHWIGRETVQIDNERELQQITAPYNVVLWLQGHGHSDIDWSVNGVPATMVKGLYQGSYNVIEVTNDELKISKRFIPDGKNKGELVRDKSVPDESLQPVTKPVMTIPLRKQPAPDWSATAELKDGEIEVVARAHQGAKLLYRINDAKPKELATDSGQAKVRIPTRELAPGNHTITVQANIENKRSYQIPIEVTIPGSVAPQWTADIHGAVQSRLVRDGDALYVSSMGNDLIALNAADGKQRWRFKTNGPVFSAAKLSEGVAYFGSADHFIYAVNTSDGSLKWRMQTQGAVLAGPNVAKGIVCVGSADTKIYGLNAADGSIAWTVQGENLFQSVTATDGERFFVGGWDNHFRCIDAATGKLLWDLELGRKQSKTNFSAFAPAITSPAVGDGKVFVSTNDGILHALNISDGSEAWKIDWKKMGYSSPLFHKGKVYCALSDEGKTFCADANTGEILWTCDTGAVIYDSSFCIGGAEGSETVFIGNVNGTLNAIEAKTGKLNWQYRLGGGHFLSTPAAADSHVLVGTMRGIVRVFPVSPR
jgi:outer membrane protein assembly factor BamB